MRKVSKVLAVGVSVAALLGVAALTATGSGAGGPDGRLVIDKAVEGTQPEGTEYRITFSCQEEGELPVVEQVVIGGPGNVVDALFPLPQFGLTCTVTEPVDGGASSVTFSCEASGAAVCEGDSRVQYSEGSSGEGRITVTNTFEEPVPPPEPVAAAIETGPTFTG